MTCRVCRELGAQVFTLGGDAGGAGVEMTLTRHVTPERDQWCRTESIGLRTEQRRDDHVARVGEPAVHAHLHAMTQPIGHQYLLGLGEPQFPRRTGMLDARQR